MQVNKIETQKKLKMLEIQAEMLKTSKKKYDITDKEISNMTPDTRFVCQSFLSQKTECLPIKNFNYFQ